MTETERVSVTFDRQVLREAREYAGDNLSGWVNDAVRQRMLLEHGRRFLAEREQERGQLPPEPLADVDRRWPASPPTPER